MKHIPWMPLAGVVKAMADSGCTPGQISAVVTAAAVEQEAALSAKRAKDAERQRRYRASKSRNVTVTDVMSRGVTVTDRDPSPDKESPHTPKEINPNLSFSLRSNETRARDVWRDLVRSEFDREFWPAYPHKVAKPAAFRAFGAARRRASLEAILEGLNRYRREKPPDRSWLNPASFLNGDRFADKPAPNGKARDGPRESGGEALLEIIQGGFTEGLERNGIIGESGNRSEHPIQPKLFSG